MRRTFLAAVIVGAALAIGACRRTPAEQPPRRPNILFILLDDLRWDALGYAGHPYVKTPQIDRIANEGVKFWNAFATTFSEVTARVSRSFGIVSDMACNRDPVMVTFWPTCFFRSDRPIRTIAADIM